jgi:thiosulfate dehydrogenase [quinone] large subunit
MSDDKGSNSAEYTANWLRRKCGAMMFAAHPCRVRTWPGRWYDPGRRRIVMVDRLKSSSHARIKLWPVAALRIYAGIFFTYNGFRKVVNDKFTDGMVGFLNGRADQSPEFYRSFVESMVIPNKEFFAGMVTFGEIAIGLTLILGLATRYAAVAGALMVTNFWLAKGQGVLDGTNHDVVWLVIFLVLALVPAGRIAGLDDGLSDKFRFLR